jgi:hypothetical protein
MAGFEPRELPQQVGGYQLNQPSPHYEKIANKINTYLFYKKRVVIIFSPVKTRGGHRHMRIGRMLDVD